MKNNEILIVEDESIAAFSLKEVLEAKGFFVSGVALSAEDALAAVKQQRPDLVLMDINLGQQQNGIEAGKILMEEYDVPVVFLTAYSDINTIRQAKEVFPYGYLVKPVEEMQLVAVAETAIYKHLADKNQRDLHKTREKFFSIIAHDLRSPLAALGVTTRLLKNKAGKLPAATLQELLEEVHLTVENIYSFTDNLLEWARIQSGKLQSHPIHFSLSALMTEVTALLKGKAADKNIVLENNIPADLAVWADRNMIKSVLLNLVQNSLKFSHPGSSVSVKATEKENKVEAWVVDTGVGMTKEQISRLFDFKTVIHTPGTQEEKGSGLGLLLCKEFIEASGGQIQIRSFPGNGTHIAFTLPLRP